MAVRMRHHLGQALGSLRYEPTPTRVRADLVGVTWVDTTDAFLVWEPRRIIPVYAVPPGDIAAAVEMTDPQPAPADLDALPKVLTPAVGFETHSCPGKVIDLDLPGPTLFKIGFLPDDPDLGGRVLLDFTRFERWRAEETELVGHAHDPFKTIEVLTSSRRVEVRHQGTLLAASSRPKMLLETGLPPRWYLPHEDVRMELLVPSETRTTCAYKGHAWYLSRRDDAEDGADLAWLYPEPLHAAVPVKYSICFWSERSDLTLDGEPVPRPVTPWSRTPMEP
ncbi:DUF427 domain-containing protein [Nocardioides speluncae]|uniref:DUF427 domain-containing protein n=1 Tax=Nocardioides speluncae TaxID=2670337 RepID=UPI000D69625E|nr:DUF427 domain-containing protein [Nocardioides speluncae]